MSDTLPNARDAGVYLSTYLEKQRALADLAAAARPANKAVLFDALARAGFTEVIVEFDGAGDSGQIEALTAYLGERVVDLPAEAIVLREPLPDATGLQNRTCPLAEAIETMAYGLLEQDHDGWANKDGAFGTFTFEVAARSIRLEYNARYTAYDSSEHVF